MIITQMQVFVISDLRNIYIFFLFYPMELMHYCFKCTYLFLLTCAFLESAQSPVLNNLNNTV